MKHDLSPATLRTQIHLLSDLEFIRVRYCYQIGSTFVACALLEDSVIDSMMICDRVKVANTLQEKERDWRDLLDKRDLLRQSTLGSLISILSRHGITADDLNYLRWLKSKRDFFIHRFFHQRPWPGDLSEAEAERQCRSLGALEIIFQRGAGRMIHILGRAGLMRVERLSEGTLAFNPDLFDHWGDS